MKKLIALLPLPFSLFAMPLKWDCNFPEAKAQTFSVYQGETVTFEPTFLINGIETPLEIEGIYYQTNGMGKAWWKLEGNTFTPTNDVGAAAYRFFIQAAGDVSPERSEHCEAMSLEGCGKNYRANGTLRMLPSPGFIPNEITLPGPTFDFDAAVNASLVPVDDSLLTEIAEYADIDLPTAGATSVGVLLAVILGGLATVKLKKQDKLKAGENITIEGNVISASGGGGSAEAMISLKYDDLVVLRRDKKLTPGMQYRITDYVATTTQEYTQSSNHPFDIIVTADDDHTLNEVARAVLHEGDTRFAGCNLDAWQIWYALDNNPMRFIWADPDNGKGVIYRMIDEWENDLPFDFKGIKLQPITYTDESFSSSDTFTYVMGDGSEDASLYGRCKYNKVGSNYTGYYYDGPEYKIPIVTFGMDAEHNRVGRSCDRIYIGELVYLVDIGDWCEDVYLGLGAFGVKIGSSSCSIAVKNSGPITIGDYCDNCLIEDDACDCKIGDGCYDIRIGVASTYINIGDNCFEIYLAEYSGRIDIGQNCNNIRFSASSCSYIGIGDNCDNINFQYAATGSCYISFESGCYFIDVPFMIRMCIFKLGTGYPYIDATDNPSLQELSRLAIVQTEPDNIIVGF